MARDNDTIRATPRCRPCKKIHFWIRLAEQVRGGTGFVNKVIVPEDWRENFRMLRKNLLKLKLPNFESKQPPKTLQCERRTFYPFSCVDAKHLFRFRSQSCVFKFIRHSVDEA